MSNRRNPYIVLGIDFGTSAAKAKRAFAKTSLRIKRTPDAPFGIEDATAAEHQLSELGDPRSSIGIFRVPADPTAYEDASAAAQLDLTPRNLPRVSVPSASAAEPLEAKLVAEAACAGLDGQADELLRYITL